MGQTEFEFQSLGSLVPASLVDALDTLRSVQYSLFTNAGEFDIAN